MRKHRNVWNGSRTEQKGTRMDNKLLLKTMIDALEDKKGEHITVLDISGISILADYFVIVSGSNQNQVKALADAVEEKLRAHRVEPKSIEGYRGAGWILMDYQDIVLHVFHEEDRAFYDLERLWRDAKVVDVKSL